MLEYFTYKKVKKHREEKAEKERISKEADDKLKNLSAANAKPSSSTADSKLKQDSSGIPILDREDERFLERLTSPESHTDEYDEDGPPPPLPPRVPTPVITWDSDADSFVANPGGKGKEVAKKEDDKKAAGNRFSVLNTIGRSFSRRNKPNAKDGLKPNTSLTVPKAEARKEEDDIGRVLDDLDLAAKNNKAFSLSKESSEMVLERLDGVSPADREAFAERPLLEVGRIVVGPEGPLDGPLEGAGVVIAPGLEAPLVALV